MTEPNPTERSIADAVPYLAAGLLMAVPLLFVPSFDDPVPLFLIQLSCLVVLGLVMSIRIAPRFADDWFVGLGWSHRLRRVGAAIVLVVLPTGVIALVTLATSSALRFDPSLQFLQLLSAMDIAWSTGALVVGAWYLWGRRVAIVAGVIMGVVCVWSVANYLWTVGTGPDGQWIVDGGDMLRLIIPFDVMAAILSVTVLVAAVRRSERQRTLQANDQS